MVTLALVFGWLFGPDPAAAARGEQPCNDIYCGDNGTATTGLAAPVTPDPGSVTVRLPG
ncbi:MAG: hypothetical protein ABMB14_36300 [Myxococcota bacterium]